MDLWIVAVPMGYVVVHFVFAYSWHLSTAGFFGIAGRYWFPVLPLLVVWFGVGLQSWPGPARRMLALTTCAVFFLGGLPWFALAAGPEWRGGPRPKTIEEIRKGSIPITQELFVYDEATGRTGDWWCQSHFGTNLGGRWFCIDSVGQACDRTQPLGAVVTCSPRYARKGHQRSTVAVPDGNPGQTGEWWCQNHFGLDIDGAWSCLSTSEGPCDVALPVSGLVECSYRWSTQTRDVLVYDATPGQTGKWWCENHFGGNLGGEWRCLSVERGRCSEDIPVGNTVTCIQLAAP